jgi:hypothetical protein
MDAKMLVKPVVLTTVQVSTSIGVTLGINKVINRVRPELLEANLMEGSGKEQAIKAAKIIAVSVGVALIAGAVAHAATNQVENVFWPDEFTFDNPQEG